MKGYDRYPAKKIADTGGSVFKGEESILKRLREELTGGSWTLVLETYPGISEKEIRSLIGGLGPDLVLPASGMLLDSEKRQSLLDEILTEDRVFGKMYRGELSDFADPVKKKALEEKIRAARGKTVVWGFGAGLLCGELLPEKSGGPEESRKVLLVYCDITT